MNKPIIGSLWKSISNDKGPYTVLFITNLDVVRENHPPHVVYVGSNGSYWSRPLSTWYDKMTPLENPSMTKSFTFKITYFKLTGKYYTEAEVSWDIRVCDDGFSCYMYDAVAKLRGLRDTGGQNSLPGVQSSWEGFILIECEQGFPCLITPRK